MSGRARPDTTNLFPGLKQRTSKSQQKETTSETEEAVKAPGLGRGVVLRKQEEIERDLLALPESERDGILSSSYLATNNEDFRDKIAYLDINLIEPNPKQPRKNFDAQKIEELAESIRLHGVLSPIHVCVIAGGKYKIIAGERRWRAARKAGRTNIPAIIKTVDDLRLMEIALLENLQREDLQPLDEARSYKMMMDQFGYTQQQLAKRIGKKQAYISKMLSLLKLAPEVQNYLIPQNNIPRGINKKEGEGNAEGGEAPLSAGAAIVLSQVHEAESQLRLAQIAVEKQMSVREVEELVRKWKYEGENILLEATGAEDDDDFAERFADDLPERGIPVVAHTRSKGRGGEYSPLNPVSAGPLVRFANLSVFQLYREVGRISHIELLRLEAALESDMAYIQTLKREAAEGKE